MTFDQHAQAIRLTHNLTELMEMEVTDRSRKVMQRMIAQLDDLLK